MATITLLPSAIGSNYKYASIASSYPLTNIVGKSSSSSSYGGINITTGSNAESYFFILFDASDIPTNATISSVSCRIKVYNSSNAINRTGTRNVQLFSGNTSKGSAQSWTDTGSQVVTISNTGSWTRDELDGLGIRCYYKRNTTQTTTSTQVYVQGAEIVIEYEERPLVRHTLTIQSNGYEVTPESGEYTEGDDVQIEVAAGQLPNITLDGNEITDEFVQKAVEESFEGAASSSSYTGISSGSNYIASSVGSTAENPVTGNMNWYGSNSATVDSQYAQYTFDLSSIPSDAVDIQVSCKVAGTAESTTYTHQSGGRYSVWGLCSNGTTKGEQIHATSTSVSTYTFTDTGSWTRAELDGLQLRHYVGYYGGSTRGVTLTVTYSRAVSGNVYVYNLTMDADHVLVFGGEDGDKLFVKQNGTWKEVNKVWKKENGTWSEVSDVASLFSGAASGTWSGYYKDI